MADALRPTLIVSSDLRRAYDTARPLAAITGLPITVDKRLREVAKGRWEGLTHAEIAQRYPDELRAWQRGQDIARGGGETGTDATARAAQAVRVALDGQRLGGVIIACTHGGLIRLLIGHLIRLPDLRALGGLDSTASAVLAYQPPGWWQLLAHNAFPGATFDQERRR